MPRRRVAHLLTAPLLALPALATVVYLQCASPPTPPPPAPDLVAQAAPPSALPLRLAIARSDVTPPAQPGAFEGRVLSAATGEPVRGAELTFARGGAADTVQAGADGSFLFQPPLAGRWLLAAVAAPGYFPFAPEWGFSPVQLESTPGRRVGGVEVFLTPAAELTGQVVDEDGAPVADAEVELLGAAGRATLIPIPGRFVTDGAGRFRAAAPQGALLEARKPGFYPGRAPVNLDVVVNGRIRIMLGARWAGPEPARAALAGRVITGDGHPVPGALVVASRTRGWAYAGDPVAQILTDGDGRFRLGGLDEAPHQLAVRADGYAVGRVERVLPGGGEVIIPLVAGGRLRGCVRDAESGAPVAPFTVQVYEARSRAWSGDPDQVTAVADPSGCFTLGELTPGRIELTVLAPRYAPTHASAVRIPAPPAQAELSITLDAGGAITGQVVDERTGAPLAGARITAESVVERPPEALPLPEDGAPLVGPTSPFPTLLAEALTEGDGGFTLRGLSAAVRVHAAAAGHHPDTSEVVQVPLRGVIGPVVLALRPVLPGDAGPVEPTGIGAVLAPDGQGLAVEAVRPGGGAAAGGLAPGDGLLEIDDRAVADLGLGGAVEALRGAEGTTVFLKVRHGGGERLLEVVRRRAPVARAD